MKKTVLTTAMALLAFQASSASLDDLKISGFGSVGIGIADDDLQYARYTDDTVNWENETLAGIQFDFQINDKAKFVTQIVANGRYNFEPEFEMAYVAYDFGAFTARGGKLRLPLYFYSDYLDLGYAYPMLRPSQELYENVLLKGYTGADMLIPLEVAQGELTLQPVMGVANVREEDSPFGEVDLDKMYGLSANWNIDDITVRGSYFIAEANAQCADMTDPLCITAKGFFDGTESTFASVGVQYDNGDLLANLEAADARAEGKFFDYYSLSSLVAYRVDEFTPYLAMGWVKTSDDEERENSLLYQFLNFERLSYSAGVRWDFAQNMALKVDTTYVDYRGTSGGYTTNADGSESGTFVYAAKLDFVF